MAQALTETALREALTKMGLVADSIRPLENAGAAGSFPAFRVELWGDRIGFSQLHFLSSAFDTWMIAIEAGPGPKGPGTHKATHVVLTIGQRQGPLEL